MLLELDLKLVLRLILVSLKDVSKFMELDFEIFAFLI